MLTLRRRLALALAALATLLATAADAGATRYYEATPGGPVTAAGRLRFTGGAYTIECNVTLTGSINAGELDATVGARHGTITGASIPSCSGGGITATLGLPWSLDYDGFTGTLPTPTALRYRINRLAFNYNVLGFINCLYSGSLPVQLALTPSGQTGAFTIAPGATVQSTSGGACPGSGTLSATFSFTQQQVTQDQVWIVSLGDSYIGGEAGRWAGNSNAGVARHDGQGEHAYHDNQGGTAEIIRMCHRSRGTAVIHIGGPVASANFACSGATVLNRRERDPNPTVSTEYDKPGLEFVRDGITGQAAMLESFAQAHPRGLKLVAVSIGGNDFGFGYVVSECWKRFYFSLLYANRRCHESTDVTRILNPEVVVERKAMVRWGLLNVHRALTNRGYTVNDYKLLIQGYPSPLTNGARFRYPETNDRQDTGGCGFWNADADWANGVVLPSINQHVWDAATSTGLTNLLRLDISRALYGHRLCETGTRLVEEIPLQTWSANPTLAADSSEWANMLRTITTATVPEYFIQEGVHPNFWGQLAIRNCMRLAYNNGAIRGGACTIAGTGLTAQGEPRMRLD